MLDISFDFFDPQPHDYHSIKLLLSQLLSHDASELDLGGITNLILEQKLVGSTVKTDGAEGDPFAVLTVLNLNVHSTNPSIISLLTYILRKTASSPELHSTLEKLFSVPANDSTALEPKHVGLVLSERLVNMPPQVVPPMYRMLGEELQWARDESEPYHFSHLLFLSRVYLASASELEEDPNASLVPSAPEEGGKKKKNKKKTKTGEHVDSGKKGMEMVWMYHAEDDFIARSATHTHVFAYTRSSNLEETNQDSFGVKTKGQVMLLPWNDFATVVDGLEGFLGELV